jgi:hypothetical protein
VQIGGEVPEESSAAPLRTSVWLHRDHPTLGIEGYLAANKGLALKLLNDFMGQASLLLDIAWGGEEDFEMEWC